MSTSISALPRAANSTQLRPSRESCRKWSRNAQAPGSTSSDLLRALRPAFGVRARASARASALRGVPLSIVRRYIKYGPFIVAAFFVVQHFIQQKEPDTAASCAQCECELDRAAGV